EDDIGRVAAPVLASAVADCSRGFLITISCDGDRVARGEGGVDCLVQLIHDRLCLGASGKQSADGPRRQPQWDSVLRALRSRDGGLDGAEVELYRPRVGGLVVRVVPKTLLLRVSLDEAHLPLR